MIANGKNVTAAAFAKETEAKQSQLTANNRASSRRLPDYSPPPAYKAPVYAALAPSGSPSTPIIPTDEPLTIEHVDFNRAYALFTHSSSAPTSFLSTARTLRFPNILYHTGTDARSPLACTGRYIPGSCSTLLDIVMPSAATTPSATFRSGSGPQPAGEDVIRARATNNSSSTPLYRFSITLPPRPNANGDMRMPARFRWSKSKSPLVKALGCRKEGLECVSEDTGDVWAVWADTSALYLFTSKSGKVRFFPVGGAKEVAEVGTEARARFTDGERQRIRSVILMSLIAKIEARRRDDVETLVAGSGDWVSVNTWGDGLDGGAKASVVPPETYGDKPGRGIASVTEAGC